MQTRGGQRHTCERIADPHYDYMKDNQMRELKESLQSPPAELVVGALELVGVGGDGG